MEKVHMRIGGNLGKILLEIAQNNILEGHPEKAFSTYIDSLQGFSKEYVMMLLKNEAVLVVNEEEQTMDLKTDSELLQENLSNMFDWSFHVSSKIKTIKDIMEARKTVMNDFEKYYNGDIENYDINKMMLRYFNEDQLKDIGYHNIAAGIIGSRDGKLHNNQYDNPQDKWERLRDDVEGGDAPKWKNVLYLTVEYVELIKMLHQEYMKFEAMYIFLVENGFINKFQYIEQLIENVMEIFKSFSDREKGYNHPMCNEKLKEYKYDLYQDLLNTKYGKEYLKNNIIEKNIMDGYDAGWLSPGGKYYADNGETSSMIHLNIAEQIFKGESPTAKAMKTAGVSIWSADDSPEYWLEKHGWIKIHHDEIYGSFIGEKDPDKRTKDFPYHYCPTPTQIEMICNYADKYYGGKFRTEPRVIGYRKNAETTSFKVRQMDEIKLHETFGG